MKQNAKIAKIEKILQPARKIVKQAFQVAM